MEGVYVRLGLGLLDSRDIGLRVIELRVIGLRFVELRLVGFGVLLGLWS